MRNRILHSFSFYFLHYFLVSSCLSTLLQYSVAHRPTHARTLIRHTASIPFFLLTILNVSFMKKFPPLLRNDHHGHCGTNQFEVNWGGMASVNRKHGSSHTCCQSYFIFSNSLRLENLLWIIETHFAIVYLLYINMARFISSEFTLKI